ncbi:MAG: DUF4388 domain-containing protein [Acidobacteria bacterium]|nr:DUF4388 domain-containing protein [Acidobacteriota bacterium]
MVTDLEPAQAPEAGRYRVLVDSPEILVLRREDRAGAGEPTDRVLMAGQIVSHSTILEIVNLIASSRWVGTLRVYGSDTQRVLGFYNGALRHAQSDHPEDRLDKVLCRLGVLAPAQVESVMRGIRPGQRFGELLVERGVLERQQLYSLLGKQMEEVLLSAVLETQGSYVFTVFDDLGTPPSATAYIPLQRLLLDAAERVDKMALFSKLVPHSEMCPEVEPGVELHHLDARSRLVIGHCNGKKSVRDIGCETWLGRFEATETVYELVRAGQVRLQPPRRSPREHAEALTAPFNRSLREIFQAIEDRERLDHLRQELHRWVRENSDARSLNGFLQEEGLIDVGSIARSLKESSSRHRVADLQATLQELTSFALFTASLWLPRKEEEELSRRINQRLEAVRA